MSEHKTMHARSIMNALCLTLVLFLCLSMCGFAHAAEEIFAMSHGSGIISEERTVQYGQAQKLFSVPKSHGVGGLAPEQVPPQEKLSSPPQSRPPAVSSASPASEISPASSAIQNPSAVHDARLFLAPKSRENLLDDMDVYALSPHAAQLMLPRMIPPTAVQEWYASHGQDQREQRRLGLAKSDWDDIIQHASMVSGLDPALIAAVIAVESDFDAYAVSPKGAQGAMQIMPETQVELGLEDVFNPHESVEAGSRYLRKQLDRFGSLELALAAYNAGAGNVLRYGGIPPFKETQDYVYKVMSRLAKGTP